MTASWPPALVHGFVWLTLLSEALLLFVAAQTGFLGGPKILANMAMDHWFPTKFAILSDRLVTHNGILCFSGAALVIIIISGGNVSHLVVLYSINVFITVVLSQAGLARRLWGEKKAGRPWRWKMAVDLVALLMCFGILVAATLYIRHTYDQIGRKIAKMNSLVGRTEMFDLPVLPDAKPNPPTHLDRTAVLLVSGYNGLGMRSLLSYHGRSFRNILFVQIRVVDSSVFQTPEIMETMKTRMEADTGKYTALVRRFGFASETFWSIGADVVSKVMKLAPAIHEKYPKPKAVFFGGQIMPEEDSMLDRLLHNYQSFSLQRSLFHKGVPFELIPVALEVADNEDEPAKAAPPVKTRVEDEKDPAGESEPESMEKPGT